MSKKLKHRLGKGLGLSEFEQGQLEMEFRKEHGHILFERALVGLKGKKVDRFMMAFRNLVLEIHFEIERYLSEFLVMFFGFLQTDSIQTMFIEHVVDKLRFHQKLEALKGTGIVQHIGYDLEIFGYINAINRMRNGLAHNIDFDSQRYEYEGVDPSKPIEFVEKLEYGYGMVMGFFGFYLNHQREFRKQAMSEETVRDYALFGEEQFRIDRKNCSNKIVPKRRAGQKS